MSSVNFVSIPKHAQQVEVTSFINPYYIRIQNKPIDKQKKDLISKRLQKLVKTIIESDDHKNYKPKVGDNVILTTSYKHNEKVDLPDWTCRGVIMDTAPQSTDVFFLDDGVTVNVPTESLINYKRSLVPIEPLTYTVGIYNVLPANIYSFKIAKEWTASTNNFVKELFQFSSHIYFETLAYDKKINKYYGDLYLVLENKNVSLREILLLSHKAIIINNDILKSINENSIEISTVPILFSNEKKGNLSVSKDDENSDHYSNFSVENNTTQFKEKILIASKFPCKPIDRIEDARFTSTLHKSLKNNGIRSLKNIQSYMWPAIKQGLNVFTISPKVSGKTLGYVAPIISAITENEDLIIRRQKNENCTKPVALILCTSVIKCIDAATKFNDLLYSHRNIKTFMAHHGLDDKKIMTQILNKFTILITTVPFLLRMLQDNPKLKLDELSYLVFDGIDVLLTKYLREIMDLIRKYKIIHDQNNFNIQEGPMQIIGVAETWTPEIDTFSHSRLIQEGPYICIGSFVEAALFSKVKGRMLICKSEKKPEKVLEVLGDYAKVKTMIFCVNHTEAGTLNDFLKSMSIDTLLFHEEMPITEIQEKRDEWMKYLPGMFPVIIRTDNILTELEIFDVQYLIHYSITNTSKTQFNKRFSVLMDNWLLHKKQDPCEILILFDETKGYPHFKGVLGILKRIGVDLPPDWDDIAKGLEVANELSKRNFPLCESLKLFGLCDASSCPYRHRILAEVDSPFLNISANDELKLMILSTINASHFTARVFECTKISSDTEKSITKIFDYKIFELSKKIKDHYSEKSNRRMPSEIHVGNIYTIMNPDNQYMRVQVQHIVDRDVRTNKPKCIKVRNIDSGEIYEKKYASELLEIPKELAEIKFPIIDIYLMGVKPPDEEYKWTNSANQESIAWVKENQEGNNKRFAYANVLYHFGHCVWTNSLVFRTKIANYPDVVSPSISSILKSKKHAIDNEEHKKTFSCLNEKRL